MRKFIYPTSKVFYDKEGRFHRENGPAIEWNNGDNTWYKHGVLHREDGPAVEYHNDGINYWWFEGKQLPSYIQSVEQLQSYIRNKILW